MIIDMVLPCHCEFDVTLQVSVSAAGLADHHAISVTCVTLSSPITMAPGTMLAPVFAVMVTGHMTRSIARTTSDPPSSKTSVTSHIPRGKTVMARLDRGSVRDLKVLDIVLEQGRG